MVSNTNGANTFENGFRKNASPKIRINVEDHAVLLDDELFQTFVSKGTTSRIRSFAPVAPLKEGPIVRRCLSTRMNLVRYINHMNDFEPYEPMLECGRQVMCTCV